MQTTGLLERARHQAGLSRSELARRAGASRPTLAAYAAGTKSPNLATAERIIQAAGFDLELVPRPVFREAAVGHGHAIYVPAVLPRLAVDRALGRVRLPLHLNWSQPGREYDLSDRRQRAGVRDRLARGDRPGHQRLRRRSTAGGLVAGPHPASPTTTCMAAADRHRPRKHSDLDASRLLTPLQVEATQLFFSLPQSAGFAVAGGAALIVQGLIQRQTKDVDLFLLDAAASTITSAAPRSKPRSASADGRTSE
jgi:transcriptional regulator with XRE-family HTH domain